MGQLLHGSARTTAALRRAIQQSQESLAKLAARYDLNPKTVAKWKKRPYVQDAPMGGPGSQRAGRTRPPARAWTLPVEAGHHDEVIPARPGHPPGADPCARRRPV